MQHASSHRCNTHRRNDAKMRMPRCSRKCRKRAAACGLTHRPARDERGRVVLHLIVEDRLQCTRARQPCLFVRLPAWLVVLGCGSVHAGTYCVHWCNVTSKAVAGTRAYLGSPPSTTLLSSPPCLSRSLCALALDLDPYGSGPSVCVSACREGVRVRERRCAAPRRARLQHRRVEPARVQVRHQRGQVVPISAVRTVFASRLVGQPYESRRLYGRVQHPLAYGRALAHTHRRAHSAW